MIALIQRVSQASVAIANETVAAIDSGLLALIGVERDDGEPQAERLLERILTYRVFADAHGRMNLSVRDIGGAILLVPQFTLAADTRKGRRASFTSAAQPAAGERLFDYLVARALRTHPAIACGRFGAHMQVSLVNDGPVTFCLRVPARQPAFPSAGS